LSPSRILLGWEHGDGLGHVMRLLPLARRLLARGHDVSFAACDLDAVRDALALEPAPGLRLLPAPPLGLAAAKVTSLADSLRALLGGTPNQAVLGAAWAGLLEFGRPDLVVADHAPMLAMLCLGRIPVQVIGDPPMVPPDAAPLPIFRPGAPSPPANRAAEAVLLAELNRLRQRAGLSPLPRLAAVLRGDGTPWIAAHPAFDPYAAMRGEPLDPAPEAAGPMPPPVADRPPIALLYATSPHPAVADIARAVAAAGLRPRVVMRTAPAPLRQALLAAGAELLDQPRPRAALLAEARLVMHGGGMGTAMGCLGSATPQIILATEYAGQLILAGLAALGLGLGGPMGQTAPSAAGLASALAGAQAPAMLQRATEVAAAIRAAGGPDPLGRLVARIEGLLAGRAVANRLCYKVSRSLRNSDSPAQFRARPMGPRRQGPARRHPPPRAGFDGPRGANRDAAP